MKNNKMIERFSLVVLIISYLIVCVFMYDKADYMLDSDMSSELILSRLLSEENGLLSRNWFYSTEIRVINTQIIWAFLFRFMDNWHLVRVLGSAICYLFLILSYLYFCKSLHMKKTAAFLSAAVLVLPTSEMYREFVFVNAGYIIYFISAFLTFGLLFRSMEVKKKSETVRVILCMTVLSVFSGMAGLRQFLVFYIPVILAAFVWYLIEKGNETRRFLLGAGYVGAMAAMGYLVNSKILGKYFYYQKFNDIKYTGLSFGRLEDVLNGCLESLGYSTGLELFDGLFYNVFAFAALGLLVISIKNVFWNFKKADNGSKILSIFFVSALTIFTALYLFSDMDWFSRYVLPIMIFAIPIITLQLSGSEGWKRYAVILLVGLLAVNSIGRYRLFWQIDKTSQLREVAAYVTENGYREGYGTFWNANVLTELTNGCVDMRNWKDSDDGIGMADVTTIDRVHEWLQLVEHTCTVPEGKCFLLLTHGEAASWPLLQYIPEENLVFENEKYYVYGFESYEQIPAQLTGR